MDCAFTAPITFLPAPPTQSAVNRNRPTPHPGRIRERRTHCARRCRTFATAERPPPPPTSEEAKRNERQEYLANVGSVIDALRADYPRLAEEEPSLELYSEVVTLRSPAGLLCQGLPAYRGVLWFMRAQLRLFFSSRSITVLGLYHDKDAAQIYVRWRLTGHSRVALASSSAFIYDGLSIYTLNDDGYISDHLLDNIIRVRRSIRPIFEAVLSSAAASAHLSGVPVRAPVAFVRSHSTRHEEEDAVNKKNKSATMLSTLSAKRN